MLTHELPRITTLENPFTFLLSTQECARQITAQELGYEFKETELAEEMTAQLQSQTAGQAFHQLEPDEFEAVYSWFLA
jgi:hypothetical protein